MSETSGTVVDAADKWLAAIEAQEVYGKSPSLEEELAEAETELAEAVRAWRRAGGWATVQAADGEEELGAPGEAAPSPGATSREARLAVARRRVAEGEYRVADQQRRIAKLECDGHSKIADAARRFLRILETSLRLAREDLARLEEGV